MHISWLFNHAGRPSLSQEWVRSILDEFYGTDGIHGYGYGQDEDQGQLGAWYVISSIGLFDVAGLANANAELSLGSPLFDSITIQLNPEYYSGESFTIETVNNSKDNKYAQRYTLNGGALHQPSLSFQDLVKGGHLKVEMGATPVDAY